MLNSLRKVASTIALGIALSGAGLVTLAPLSGCSSSSQSASDSSLALTISSASLTMNQSSTSASISATLARGAANQSSVTLSVSGLPSGVTANITSPAYGNYGSLTLTTGSNVTAGTYALTVTASDGAHNAAQALSLTVYPASAVTITPSSTSLTLYQQTATSIPFTITRSTGNTNSVSVSAAGAPTNFGVAFSQPGGGNAGVVSLTAGSSTAVPTPGTYTITLTATDGTVSSTANITVLVGVAITVANSTNTAQGISGKLQEFMSTGFQPQLYTNSFFVSAPSTASLSALGGQHLRLQPTHYDLPWVANSSPAAASDWSFTLMDQTVQPVLSVGDNSPIFQIAQAPNFLDDANGNFIFNTTNLALFAQYAANLVRYYNKGGFDAGGKHFQSTSSHPITWWAIYNEPNLHSMTTAQYVQLYNTLVPAMQAVDPTLKFIALELSGYSGQAQLWMPSLVATSGLTAQVDAFATHYYPTCKQTDTDSTLFTKVSTFVTDMTYIRTQLKGATRFANTPVWVTENNVNSDYQLTGNISSCNGGTFVSDARGSSGFFTAWRPLIFSQLGKAGNQSLYHFLFNGSNQYGEVNNDSGASKLLSYWTDYELAHLFPWDGTAATGGTILTTTTSEITPTVEPLIVRNADGSYTVMVTDYAVASTTDDNGSGAARTVKLDLTALGSFTSGTRVDLNSATSLTAGPTSTSFTPTATMTLNFTGYGTTFLTLKP
ncbi:glycosyl hydrolase [Granulicella cerasi]|uniref:Glycosyl hydrolase n=1 Tax=Granulicella cerasi TaxID=741063 RepID=A0ABW1Z861_9BACT|nr:glycosyl hydrolase [Granulicella cerasi]